MLKALSERQAKRILGHARQEPDGQPQSATGLYGPKGRIDPELAEAFAGMLSPTLRQVAAELVAARDKARAIGRLMPVDVILARSRRQSPQGASDGGRRE
jgi:hypothetical protein